MLRLRGKRLFSRGLRLDIATGFVKDHEPHWPVPLPPPLSIAARMQLAQQQQSGGAAPTHTPVGAVSPAHPRASSQEELMTLVLDIDETLLHTIHHEPHPEKRHLDHYHVLLRPHVDVFLREVSSLFEVVLWTAGIAAYGGGVTNLLERVSGLPPSGIYDAEQLWAGLQKDAEGTRRQVESADHVHWYLLSRTQTLESQNWMKFIPMLGRKQKSVVMIDDNVRSFPLTPRNGVKISPFAPSVERIEAYFSALQHLRIAPEAFPHNQRTPPSPQQQGSAGGEGEGNESTGDVRSVEFYERHVTRGDKTLAKHVYDGVKEIERLESDRALLDLLPMLRAIAQAKDADAVKELDHWRPDNYVMCDNFLDNMKPDSLARRGMLGTVLSERRSNGPIEGYKPGAIHNFPLTQEAKQNMQDVWARHGDGAMKRKGSLWNGGRMTAKPRSNL